ncbi:cytochrome P450 [uncultured Jatrophihabitans sp.]|uniref:cytochrome P450 n=1 Tax=uncultured Jatrophihabitans sp. TaxID=1610747 RepID=UPI0035CA5FE0
MAAKTVDEILEHLDVFDPDQRENFVDALAEARTRCPVLHTESDGGYYLVTKYADVRTVCEHPETYSSANPAVKGALPVRLIPLDADPPEHRGFRQLLNPYFSRSFLMRYEADMRKIAQDAIAKFIDRGEFEAVSEFAIPFSAGSLARIVLVTDDQDLVDRGVAAVKRTAVESTPETFGAVAMIAMEAMAEAEANAAGREDVLAAIVTAEIDGAPLTPEQRLGIITTLFLGGLDTTRGMLVNIAYHLAARPDIEARLVQPDWWRGELDEFLRYEPTVSFMARTVTQDTVLGGVELKAGDRVVPHFFSANRDEERFEHAHELDLDRTGNPHAAFGLGVHRCLGLNFARIQLAIAFEELLRVATNFRVKPGTDIPRQMGVPLNSPESLHLQFDRR